MNQVEAFKRRLRLEQAAGMSLIEIGTRGMVERKDWIELAGARYPNNECLWGRKLNGKPRYLGTIPADKREGAR